jgi:hypothetical protein
VAWGALILLVADLTCAVRPGPGAPPLVLLDGSMSMAAAGGRWKEALDSARTWGEVRLFGDEAAASDSLPDMGQSALAPALRAAAASDRRVLVVSDGEIDDAADLPPELLARAGVRLFPRVATPDLAILRVDGPTRLTAGDTLRLDAELHAQGVSRDSARVEVRLDGRVLARRAVRLGTDGSVVLPLAVPTAGLQGDLVFEVALAGNADAEPRDDSRLWLVRVTPTPGVVLLASPVDWDARFLLRTIRTTAELPVRGYLQVEGGRWRGMESLAPVATADVARAARGADLLVVKGAAPDIVRDSRARSRWIWPSGEGGETVLPGEWYAVAEPVSPVAGAFVGQPVDSFPPLVQITPIEPAAGDWVGLVVQQGRRGVERAVLTGRVEGGRRRVLTSADGLWRWAFRGGASGESYRALVAATVSWLLAAPDSAGGPARPVRAVVPDGRPVVFEWTGGGAPEPLAVTLSGPGSARTDTLRFDGAGRAQLRLRPGQYRYQLAGGGAGTLAMETWSPEFIARPPSLAERPIPASVAGGVTTSRGWLWLFGLALAGLAGEWVMRRRLGLR